MDLPRILTDLEPAPGLIKSDYDDFVVEEVPLYPADGVGTHTYFLLEKAGLSTQQAVNDLARALNIKRHEIGFAGLKDSKAVTRQWMSIEHVPADRLKSLDIPRLRILETSHHRNKIRLGHLKGNHFTIKVRQSEPDRLAELQDGLSRLTTLGIPNYFGPQRFGYRGDTWAIGRALLLEEAEQVLTLILGQPIDTDHGAIRTARKHFDAGRFEQAHRAWPGMFHTERRLLKTLLKTGGNRKRALASIDKSTRTFFVSAYQSYLFNQVVIHRLKTGLHRLLDGDLAWLHRSGAVFHVEDAAREQPRAESFEISPSGPLFGSRMTEPTGQPAQIEQEILNTENLTLDSFRHGRVRARGARRPLRFRPEQAQLSLGADQRGPYLELQFMLPPGCYATVLLHELFRTEAPRDSGAEGRTEDTDL